MGTTADNVVLARLSRKHALARKKEKEQEKLARMHERNLVSQWAKERLRDEIHLDASEFEADRMKLMNHAKTVQFLGRWRCKILLQYDKFLLYRLTNDQVGELQDKKWHTPKHLFRVSSGLSSQKPPYYQATNGLDSKDVHVPAALCQKYDGNHSIADSLSNETKIIQKVGHRLMWYDRNRDPFLSWTPSMLFVLVLGTARLARGESIINITSVDTEQAERAKVLKEDFKVSRDNPNKNIKLGLGDDEPRVKRNGNAKFYFAERLLRETNLRCWSGWRPGEVAKLTSDWFTGEWLSHGIVLSENGSHQARLADLLDAGLYNLHQQLLTEEGEDMRSLYHRCVRARSLAFSVHDEGDLLTMEELQGNSNLAALFMNPEERKQKKDDPDSLIPPLHIFLGFLGLRKRVRKDHLFMQWIRDHYTATDITACGYEKTTKIANNLPEVMETIHLARDACIALEIPEIPSIPVWLADPDFDFDGQWLHEFPKEVKIKAPGAGRSKLKEVIEFDENGMALFVKVHKNGWDVQRKWEEVEVEEGDEDVEVEVVDLEGRELAGGDGEGQDDGIDVDMEVEQASSEEQQGSTGGDGNEDMMGVTEEDLSVEKSEALAASTDGDEASVLAEEEEVSRDEDDLMIAGSGKQKSVGAEMEMEEEMALV